MRWGIALAMLLSLAGFCLAMAGCGQAPAEEPRPFLRLRDNDRQQQEEPDGGNTLQPVPAGDPGDPITE